MSLIEVQNITKKYGDTVAAKNLNFEVEQGEILGFLGPNGAGKTTTMRIITGYIPPSSGEVFVDGYNTFDDPLEVKKRIGYLPENPPLYDNMKVDKFLNFIAELKEVPRDEKQENIDRVIDRLSLGSVRDRLIDNISKGFRQRVGLAQALIGDPEVLILDEPTTGLDPKQIIEIRELIKELSEDKTIILSSHILPEVNMIAERVLIINEGEIVAQDTTEELSNRIKKGESLKVKVDGPEDEVKAEIDSLSGVEKVTLEDDVFTIESKAEADIRRDVFFKMADLGYPILEMNTADLSLEEIFLELTTQEEAI